jgi:hypothetical protein
MKKIYLTLLVALAVLSLKASPDIYAPQLTAPANNATGIFPDVTLDWEAVTGLIGLHYELQLSTTEDFASPVTFNTDLTSYKMSLLLFAQDYFWRVRAIDNSATSDWSSVRKFTVIPTVIIRRPNDLAAGVNPNVQIIWQDITGIPFLDYQVDTAATFDSPLMSIRTVANNPGNSQTNASSLLFGQKYYLRMRGHHAADTSDWTEARSFTVVNVLALKKPDNNVNSIAPNVTFEWTKIDGLLKYQILLSQDPTMNQYEVYNVAANLIKVSPDTLLFGTTYYWQMAAIHAADTLMSDVRSFTVINKVTLTSPSNNATNIELQPVLKWANIAGVLGYQLDIAHNPEFNGLFSYDIDLEDDNEFKVPIHVLDSATVYYWRVRAISSRDTSAFSDTWSFRSVALGKEENAQVKNGINVFPVPAVNKVNIRIRSTFNGEATIEVYDLLGTRRLTTNAFFNNGYMKDIQIGNLPDGIYMISVIADGQRSTTKLIIKK